MATQKLTVSQKLTQLKSVFSRDTAVIFTIAFVAVFVSMFNQAAMLETKSKDIVVLDHLKEWAFVFLAIFGGVFGLMFSFYAILSRKTRTTTALTKKVVKAYQQALDESSLILTR
ncbi:MAG TPA: hypothetical protein VJS17_02605 [Pyrinomonadaceae bacterium]|nr:hypothetical protein [Pyrinomonadaceae bacterium]